MTIQYTDKPIPHPALWGIIYRSSTPFWEGIKEKKLLIQKCRDCGKILHPPRPMCPGCHSTECEHIEASGKGTIYSYTTYSKSPHKSFKAPYSVVLVELDEGPRLISNMVDVKPEDIEIGMPVEVAFDKIDDDLTLYKFKKAG